MKPSCTHIKLPLGIHPLLSYSLYLSLIRCIYKMSHINLFLAGGSDQSDSLYAACSVYLLQQMRIVQYAVLDEERDKALVRIEHIKDILLQIEDQD